MIKWGAVDIQGDDVFLTHINHIMAPSAQDESASYLMETWHAEDIGVTIVAGSVHRLPSYLTSAESINSRVIALDHTHSPRPILYDPPTSLGLDRIAGCVAAWHRRPQCAIVVDMGTATTYTVLSPDGSIVGGLISPGLTLSRKAMVGRFPQFEGELAPPVAPKVPWRATSTRSALRNGLWMPHVAVLRMLASDVEADYGEEPIVWVTGGDASRWPKDTPPKVEIQPYLVLEGIARMGAPLMEATDA